MVELFRANNGLPTPDWSFGSAKELASTRATPSLDPRLLQRQNLIPITETSSDIRTPPQVTDSFSPTRRTTRLSTPKAPGYYDKLVFPNARRNQSSLTPKKSPAKQQQKKEPKQPVKAHSRHSNGSFDQELNALHPVRANGTSPLHNGVSKELPGKLEQSRFEAAVVAGATKLCREREAALLSILHEAKKQARALDEKMEALWFEGRLSSTNLELDPLADSTPSSSSNRRPGSCTVQTFGLTDGRLKSKKKSTRPLTSYDPAPVPPHAPIVMPAYTNFLTPEQEPIKYIPIVKDKNMIEYLDSVPQAVQDAIDMSDINNVAEEKAHFFRNLAVELFRTAEMDPSDIVQFLLGKLRPKQPSSPDASVTMVPEPGFEDLFPYNFSIEDTEYSKLLSAVSNRPMGVAERAVERTAFALEKAIDCSTWTLLGLTTESESSLLAARTFMSSPKTRRTKCNAVSEIPESTTYLRLSCMICSMHDCPTHGDYQGPKNRTMLTRGERQLSLTIAQVRQLLDAASEETFDRPRRRSKQTPCSPQCMLNPEAHSTMNPGSWTDADLSVISRSSTACGDAYDLEACVLAPTIDKPCIDVFRALRTVHRAVSTSHSQPDRLPSSSPLQSRTTPPSSQPKPNPHQHQARSAHRSTTNSANTDEPTNPLTHSMLVPCVHDGACVPSNAACLCIDRQNPGKSECEKFCQCSGSCSIRFRGCDCAKAVGGRGRTCAGEQCVCWRNFRECDPDLCGGCGVRELLFPPTQEGAESGGKRKRKEEAGLCLNAGLTVGRPKRTFLGSSLIKGAGYGLFMGENVSADHYLGEYVGELLDHGETERRGELYDYRGVSYLFGANTHQTIDATVWGNEFRYINHGAGRVQNCYPRVMLVNGCHRIAFMAAEDLRVGQELYFDYGYSKESKGFVAGLPRALEEERVKEREKEKARVAAAGTKARRSESTSSSWKAGSRTRENSATRLKGKGRVQKKVRKPRDLRAITLSDGDDLMM